MEWRKKRILFNILFYFVIFNYFFYNFYVFAEKIEKIFIHFFNSLIITFFSIELYLIYKQNNYKYEELERIKIKAELYDKIHTKKYDTRTKIQIFHDLKKDNNNISVTTHLSDYLNYRNTNFLPLGSKSLSRTILCNENG